MIPSSFPHTLRLNALTGCLALLAAFALPARAASVYITVNGTIHTTPGNGGTYTVDEAVSFTFITNSSLGLSSDHFFPGDACWNYEEEGQTPVWSNIIGTGLTGQLTSGGDPSSMLWATRLGGVDNLYLAAATDSSSGIGLSKNGELLSRITVEMIFPEGTTLFPPTLENETPLSLLPSSGTYTSFAAGSSLRIFDNTLNPGDDFGGNYDYYANISSVTFSLSDPSAVPEPSRALLLIAGLGAAALRRRRA